MSSQETHGQLLLAYFKEHCGEILNLTRWLVEHESMTAAPERVDRLAGELAARLTEFGATVDLLRSPQYGASVRARFDSDQYGPDNTPERRESERRVLVVGHIDTVWPIGTLETRPFRIEGGKAYGPGIFDMKSGVAVALSAIQALKELNRRTTLPVTLLLTCDEESGSPFSREIIEEEAKSASAALVLEPPIPGGKLKTGRKGVGIFDLTIRGRSAHAGNDPRSGISAITELAHQVLAITALNDFDRGTTLNVGVVQGGILSNVIPDEARASIDIRFKTPDEGERIVRALNSLTPVLAGASLEIHGGVNRPPMIRTEQIGEMFRRASKIAAEIGCKLEEGAVGGGSDGNFIAALGVPVLDGLGVDGAGAHAADEHILIDDIPRCATLVTRLIETL